MCPRGNTEIYYNLNIIPVNKTLRVIFTSLEKTRKGTIDQQKKGHLSLSQASSGSSFVLTLVLFLKDFDYHILS